MKDLLLVIVMSHALNHHYYILIKKTMPSMIWQAYLTQKDLLKKLSMLFQSREFFNEAEK